VDLEAIACVHSLQYSTVQYDSGPHDSRNDAPSHNVRISAYLLFRILVHFRTCFRIIVSPSALYPRPQVCDTRLINGCTLLEHEDEALSYSRLSRHIATVSVTHRNKQMSHRPIIDLNTIVLIYISDQWSLFELYGKTQSKQINIPSYHT